MPGHVRYPLEIIQMADGNQTVQVHQSGPVLRQQDDMAALPDGSPGQRRVQFPFGSGFRMLFPGLLKHPVQALRRRRGVVDRPVGIFQADAQLLAH